MKITQIFIVLLFFFMLLGCGTRNLAPSASNCYGNGQTGCEQYWGGGKPKLVTIDPPVTDEFIRKFKTPSKEKYINRSEVYVFKRWSKPGTSKLEKEKALLECGSGEYLNDHGYQHMKNTSLEDYNAGLIRVQRCMLQDGFRYLGKFEPCRGHNPPSSCQIAAPARDLNTRVNSQYCVANAYIDACQPQSIERILATDKCQKSPYLYFCQPSYYGIDICERYPKSENCQPEQDTITQEKPNSGSSTYLPQSRSVDMTNQLQRNVQNQNNRQMNDMLRNVAPR